MTRGIASRLVWAVAIVVVATTATKAFGFYFLGWPAGPKVPASLVTPSADGHNYPPGQDINPGPSPTNSPGVNPTTGTNPPSDPPSSGPPKGPGSGPEPTAPEPGTLVLAAVGLGLAGLMRAWRKGRPGAKPEAGRSPRQDR
jgi:hypothetical protein